MLSLGLDLFGDAGAAEKAALEAVEAAKASDDHQNAVFTLIPQAARALGDGHWRLALDLAAESVAQRPSVQGATVRLWLPDAWQALICLPLGRLDEAFALIEAGLQAAQRDGVAANIPVWSMLRLRALYGAGRLADARAEAEATIELADETGDGSGGYISHVARYVLGRIALHTGDPAGLAQARQTAAALQEPAESPASQRLGGLLAALLADAHRPRDDQPGDEQPDPEGGRAGISAGVPVQLLDPLAAGPLPATSPLGYADAATVTRLLLAAGRTADAASVAGRLADFAARHPDFPFLEPAALQARALLDRDHDAAGRAARLSARDPRPLVRGAVLEDAGRLLPAARKAEAVRLLETALGCYAAVGAERDAARVRRLLRARGVRPPSAGPRQAAGWPELTESEVTVVGLVARGATNREVAERLFLSPYTVSSHLRHVFAKLGIRSRSELAHIATARGSAM